MTTSVQYPRPATTRKKIITASFIAVCLKIRPQFNYSNTTQLNNLHTFENRRNETISFNRSKPAVLADD